MTGNRSQDGEDHFLVARVVASHDVDAFGELIRRHQSHVRNFMRKLTGDVSAADDLAQDAFMHAWDKLSTYSGKGSFVGWLLKVAYTTFLQSKRKSKRYTEILDEATRQNAVLSRGHATLAEEAPDLERLLAVLSDEERAVMIMSYSCGLSHREIGEATGQPVGTVKSIIHRSKDKIRTSFELEDHKYG